MAVKDKKKETISLEEDGIDASTVKKEDKSFVNANEIKKEEKTFVNNEVYEKRLESNLCFGDKGLFKTPDSIPLFTDQPSTSTSVLGINSQRRDPSEYKPVGGSRQIDNESTKSLLSLRSGGDYKYSYEDIITGTFEEKLDECLSKGISINASNPHVRKLNEDFFVEYQHMILKNGFKRMLVLRENLPAYQRAREILEVINRNQVTVISGETGCGKSTQVPQILLDYALRNKNGANVKILVTQPRRIVASSLAARVATEREESIGNSVGYAIRLEKVEARPRGSIMFCTTGILLTDLEMKQGLPDYSHIIIDEVHERDCNIDLSMCILKKVLSKRKDLKLILMSATLDAQKLSQYFDNCPMLHIEGLAYPVEDIYLEGILQLTKFQLNHPNMSSFPTKPRKLSKRGQSLESKIKMAQKMEQNIPDKHEIKQWLASIKYKLNPGVYKTLQDRRIEDLNIDLILHLLIYICHGAPGAILVFLPGIGDIWKLLRLMNESNMFPESSFVIYPLHSKLPSLEQHLIFERPPPYKRKIIVATNIAETSITIDDIVYVVDCGRVKTSGLSIDDNVTTLKNEWISQANLRQRRGRAGRCQNGVCFHLFTSYRASKLAEHMLPELQKSNLLEPVLIIKRLRLGKAAEALSLVPSPPSDTTVKWAVKHLQQCGGLDDNEMLTPLGWHLARLPVHPSAGKLLLLGALFGCIDRAASVAAVWGYKDPFQLIYGKEIEAVQRKRQFALGEPSDHVAISEAIIQWERCVYQRRRAFAYENFLSNNTLDILTGIKNQLGDSLRHMGFLTSGDVRSQWENRNANNLSLFKAIVAASLYPNIATVRWANLNKPSSRIVVRTPEDMRTIAVHNTSVMFIPRFNKNFQPKRFQPIIQFKNPGQNWLVYWLKQYTTDVYLLENTLVYTLPLLFFGELCICDEDENSDECFMSVSTIKVKCKKETAQLIFYMRSMLDNVLAQKVTPNSTKHNDFQECVLNAVIELITAEDEKAEYLEGDDDFEQLEEDCLNDEDGEW